ncbi:MAG: RHS repeat-associated core domain-containing protein [Nitrospirae bacterium]|nr:RHS repeat-associated core domain-containing protein [Nitrospirota bacterium]
MIFSGDKRIVAKPVGSSSLYFYHGDHLGSTSVVTDSTGTQVQALTYYPFGQTRTNVPGTPVNVAHKYTGKELDNATGLYWYEWRTYDPVLARFTTPDTIVPNPRDPQDLNRYSYVGNNPLRYTDPTGHLKINKFFKRAFGDVGTLALGIGVSFVCPVCGAAIMTQSQSGRYALAGAIVAGTAVATYYCGGCAVGWGALAGEAVLGSMGGYSAARSGGDISQGVLVGTAAGGASGALLGAAWTVSKGATLLSWQTAAFFGSHIGAGAVSGAASGATVGYAGGAGSWDSIAAGAWRGAAVGGAVAGLLAGIDYAGGIPISKIEVTGLPGQSPESQPLDLAKILGGISKATTQALTQASGIASLAVSGTASYDVLSNGRLSSWAIEIAGKEGIHGHCTVPQEGNLRCGLGSP